MRKNNRLRLCSAAIRIIGTSGRLERPQNRRRKSEIEKITCRFAAKKRGGAFCGFAARKKIFY